VRIINGTRLKLASIIAGYKLAVAVPEVVIITTGVCDVFAIPNAKKPLVLSSIILWHLILAFSINPIVKGVFLDPGEIHACLTPHIDKISAVFLDHNKLEIDN